MSALNVGSSTITVKIGNVSRSFKVTVAEKTVPATGLTLAPKSLELVEGQTKSINATVAPSNSTDNVVWPSSSYLTSNGGGSYTAKKTNDSESFDLEVKAGAVSAKAGVTVYPMWFVESVSDKLVPDGSTYKLDKDENIACFFSKQKFSATRKVLIHNGILPAGDFTVTSSNNSVATVKKVSFQTGSIVFNGFSVSALNVGSSTITVKIGDVSRSFKVTVTDKTIPATGLTVSPQKIAFVEGQTKSFSATVTPSNSTDNVVWPSSSYLTSNGGGSYTAKKTNDAERFNLEVKAGAVSAKADVMVFPMWFVHYIRTLRKYVLVPDGSTYKLDKDESITCYFAMRNSSITDKDMINKAILPKEDFSVSSSNKSVATVSKVTSANREYHGFKISGVSEVAGTSTITVKIGHVSRSFKVTVTDKTVPATGLTLTPESLAFVEGQTKSIRAAVTPSNSTDNVVWPGSSFLTSNGGGSYTAKQYDGGISIGFGLDVRAGSVKATANVIVYRMQLYSYDGKKFEYELNDTQRLLKKNKRIVCYFAKYKSPADFDGIINKGILPAGDFTVTSSDNSVATVKKESIDAGDRECNGFSVTTLNLGRSTITVKIGNVSRSFDVLVTK